MPYCRNCGRELKEGEKFCSYCGAPVEPTPSTPVSSGAMSPQTVARPLGISVLAGLQALVSLFMLFGALALIALSIFLAAGGSGPVTEGELERAIGQMPWAVGFTGVRLVALTTTFVAIMGIVMLAIAIIGFVLAWGLWTGKRWARMTTLVLSAIAIFFGLFSLPGSLVSILIYAAIIYYLTRPYVKAYYSRQ